MLEVRERARGQRPGDSYVRIVRPFEEEFEHGDEGHLIASEQTIDARSGTSRAFRNIRNFLFGRPISSEHEEHERLTKVKALAIFSSDNISSSAYGPEEIMRVLALAGLAVMSTWTVTLAVLIIIMLAIVTISYRQTIKAYPNGASSYIVAGDNLGDRMGILAASALLIGYVVTVAVSISAGVALPPSMASHRLRYPRNSTFSIMAVTAVSMLRTVSGVKAGAHASRHCQPKAMCRTSSRRISSMRRRTAGFVALCTVALNTSIRISSAAHTRLASA